MFTAVHERCGTPDILMLHPLQLLYERRILHSLGECPFQFLKWLIEDLSDIPSTEPVKISFPVNVHLLPLLYKLLH